MKIAPTIASHPMLLRAVPAAQALIREDHFSLENLCHALDCSLRDLAEAAGSLDELMAHVNDHFMAGYLEKAKKVESEGVQDMEAIKRLTQLWLDYALDHPKQMKVLLQHRWAPGYERPDWYMARVAACFVPTESRLKRLAPQASADAIKAAARAMYAEVCGLYFLSVNERATPAGIASRQKVLELSVGWMVKGLAQA